MTGVLERLSNEEEQILRSWLSGNAVTAIARARRCDPTRVAAIVDRLCNYDRQRGRALLDTGIRPAEATPEPTPPGPTPPEPQRAANLDFDAELLAAASPEPEVLVRRKPSVPLVRPASVDELLARAERSSTGRARALAERIRRDAQELATVLDRAEVEEAARALVTAKRRELDEAEAKLRELTGKTAKPATPGRPKDSVVRQWCRDNGVECNPHGRVPTHVLDAYRDAVGGDL